MIISETIIIIAIYFFYTYLIGMISSGAIVFYILAKDFKRKAKYEIVESIFMILIIISSWVGSLFMIYLAWDDITEYVKKIGKKKTK